MLPYEPDPDLDLSGTRVFVAAGGQDPYVPPGQSHELDRRLREAGAAVDFRMEETVGHGLTQADLQALGGWLVG